MRLLRSIRLNWGLRPQTPGIYRFQARMACGGGGLSRLLPFRLLSRRSGCVPALPYPPLRYFQSGSHQPRRAMIFHRTATTPLTFCLTRGVHPKGGRVVRVGNREPGQGLGDLRPESAPAQPDVEDAADRQPGAAGQGGGADSARLRESRPVAEGPDTSGRETVQGTRGEDHGAGDGGRGSLPAVAQGSEAGGGFHREPPELTPNKRSHANMRNPHRIVYNLNVIRNALTGLAAFILGDLP